MVQELLEYCSRITGCEEQLIEKVVEAFLAKIVDELAQGRSVNLGSDFGIFTIKLRSAHLQDGSPRTPKDSRYKVIFRENNGMKRRLKIVDEYIPSVTKDTL